MAAGDTEFFDYTRTFGLWFAVWDPATGYSGNNSLSDWYYTPSNGEADNKITYYYKTVFGANEAPGLKSIRVSYELNGAPIGRAHSGDPGSDDGIWDVDLTDDLVDGQGGSYNRDEHLQCAADHRGRIRSAALLAADHRRSCVRSSSFVECTQKVA